jgi:putative acetyltransferase
MSDPAFTLRPYDPADEAAAIELWRRTWQEAYPIIDFSARLDWWRKRWHSEVVPKATVIVAEQEGNLVGFVTVDATNNYLDQIVVAPEVWTSGTAAALLDEAKRLSPLGLTLHVNKDNGRAIRFYEKHGFAIAAEETNPRSGASIYRMRWRG